MKVRVRVPASTVALLCGATTCTSLASSERRTTQGSIALAYSVNRAAVVGPYTSVVDSLAISIAAADASTQIIGRHLTPADTVLSIPVRVPTGSARFAVQVLSNNKTPLFSGQTTSSVDRDGFSVVVPLVAQRPVLLATPDLATGFVESSGRRTGSVTVQNRGLDSLVWSVKSVDPAFGNCDTRAPVLALSIGAVNLSAVSAVSGPAPQSVAVMNAGGGTLAGVAIGTITYGAGATGWLIVNLTGSTIALSAGTAALSAGTYTATVSVGSTNGGAQNIVVTLTIGLPVITFTPGAVTFASTAGGNPLPQTISVSNIGTGTFADLGAITVGTITYGPGATSWLAGAPSNNGTTITLNASTGQLSPGTYTATVPVSSAGGGAGTIGVTLTVAPPQAAPRLVVSATTLTFGAPSTGGNAPTQVIRVFNAGGGALTGVALGAPTYGPGASGWLSTSLFNDTISVTASRGALAAGTYTATFPVSSANGGSQTISVTFVVSAVVGLVSPTSISFFAVAGGASALPLFVTVPNAASAAPSFTYGPGASGWLTGARVGPNAVSLTAISKGLAAGTYTATARVSDVFGNMQNVVVSLTLGQPKITVVPGAVAFSATQGGANPVGQQLTLTNTGVGAVADLGGIVVGQITYGPGASGWLVAGTSGSTIALIASTGSLAPGSAYSASFLVTSANGGNQTVSVTFAIAAAPRPAALTLSAKVVSAAGVVGGGSPLSQVITVSNTGNGSLTGLALGPTSYGSTATGWLSASLTGNTIVLSPSAGSLGSGAYTAFVPVLSANGGTQAIAVNFNVSQPASCVVLPLSGRLAANAGAVLSFIVPAQFAPGTFRFVLTSPEGDVTVRWRYP